MQPCPAAQPGRAGPQSKPAEGTASHAGVTPEEKRLRTRPRADRRSRTAHPALLLSCPATAPQPLPSNARAQTPLLEGEHPPRPSSKSEQIWKFVCPRTRVQRTEGSRWLRQGPASQKTDPPRAPSASTPRLAAHPSAMSVKGRGVLRLGAALFQLMLQAWTPAPPPPPTPVSPGMLPLRAPHPHICFI